MEKVIYNLVFNRKKQLNAEGKALIQVEAYLNRQKRYFSTKVYVKPCQWDNKRRSIKNHPNMDALNLYLQNYVMELERDELEKRQANNGFSLKDLREEASSTSCPLCMFYPYIKRTFCLRILISISYAILNISY